MSFITNMNLTVKSHQIKVEFMDYYAIKLLCPECSSLSLRFKYRVKQYKIIWKQCGAFTILFQTQFWKISSIYQQINSHA